IQRGRRDGINSERHDSPTPGPLLVQELIPPSAVILLVTNNTPTRTPGLARPNFLCSIFTPDQKFLEMSDISRPNSNAAYEATSFANRHRNMMTPLVSHIL